MDSEDKPPVMPLPEEKVEAPYERRFSVVQRLFKVLIAPREAMRDIAFAPDYEGPVVVIVAESVLALLTFALVFQKISLVGPYASAVMGFVSVVLAVAFIIGVILTVGRWLVKAWIVKYACDSESGWDFKTAASVTGYSYFPAVVLGFLSMVVLWFLMPSFVLDTSNLEADLVAANAYSAELQWLMLVYGLPFSFVVLIWKSYLGGLGAHFGTREKCSLGLAFVVFFLLGLVGFLISFGGYLL